MMNFLYLLLIATALASCTPKTAGTKQSTNLPYQSEISYIYKPLNSLKNAAKFNGIDVTWEQLRDKDPALKELETRLMNKALVYSYSSAKKDPEIQSNPDATISITVYHAQPEQDTEIILQAAGVEPVQAIQVQFKEPADLTTIAQIGHRKISFNDFLKSNFTNAKMYQKIFKQRLRKLNGIVVRRSVFDAAKKENINMELFIKEKILVDGPIEVSNEDIKAFAKKRGISQGDLNEALIKRLKPILIQEDRDQRVESYAAKNLIKQPVAVSFPGPSIQIKAPNITSITPTWGSNENSEIVYIGHWDCKQCQAPLQSFLKAKNNLHQRAKGSFIFSFPLNNRESRMSAEASLCVHKQKAESFWLFVEKIKTELKTNPEDAINMAAKSTGVDFTEFRKCFLAREFQNTVSDHLEYVGNLGITEPPLLVVNGSVLEPPLSKDGLVQQLVATTEASSTSLIARLKSFFSNLFS